MPVDGLNSEPLALTTFAYFVGEAGRRRQSARPARGAGAVVERVSGPEHPAIQATYASLAS